MRKIQLLILIAVIIGLVVAGCNVAGKGSKGEHGSMVISIDDSKLDELYIGPGIDLTLDSYDIFGVHAADPGETFTLLGVAGGLHTITDLKAGSWLITVDGFNASLDHIGYGTGIGFVPIAGTGTCEILIGELDGQGDLELNVFWDPAMVVGAISVHCTLTILDGAPVDLSAEFDIDEVNGEANYLSLHDHGFYLMLLELREDGVRLFGVVEAVRIIADFASVGDITAHIWERPGDIEVTITPDIANPVTIDDFLYEDDTSTYVDIRDIILTNPLTTLNGHFRVRCTPPDLDDASYIYSFYKDAQDWSAYVLATPWYDEGGGVTMRELQSNDWNMDVGFNNFSLVIRVGDTLQSVSGIIQKD